MEHDFGKIASEASALAQKERKIDWSAVALNVLLVPVTLGAMAIDTDDQDALRKVPMPDDWLQAVASLPELSRQGLELLSRDLADNGYVSIHTATEFVELERAAAEKRNTEGANRTGRSATGAAMLLARAENELPGSIARFADGAKDVAGAALGVASFTFEKAVWVGKGLGSLASRMKELRK